MLVLALAVASVLILVHRHRSQPPTEPAPDGTPGVVESKPSVSTSRSAAAPSTPGQTLDDYYRTDERRAATIHQVWPDLTEAEIRQLMAESDRIHGELEAAGIGNGPLHLRAELKELDVPEELARAYYEDHRESFGDRSFEESRSSVEAAVRLRLLRRQYSAEGDLVVLVEETGGGDG